MNIFEKDFLIVPINKNAHWNLAIICYPGLIEPVYEETSSRSSQATNDDDEEMKEEDAQDVEHNNNISYKSKSFLSVDDKQSKRLKTSEMFASTKVNLDDADSVDEADTDVSNDGFLTSVSNKKTCLKM